MTSSASSAQQHPRRKELGAFYTPADVAQLVAARAMTGLPSGALRVLDPACGDGSFLSAAWLLLQRCLPPEATPQHRADLAAQCLFGVDIDGHAVSAARSRLLAEVLPGVEQGERAHRSLRARLDQNLHCGDGLLTAPSGAGQRPFDIVLTNPPFLNSRRQSQQLDPRQRELHRQQFVTARGAYDLFVLFLERAWQLLRDGGQCGAVVPNKLAVLDYAEPCRRLLSEQADLQWIVDASQLQLFPGAGVYPLLIGFAKSPPPLDRPVQVVLARDRGCLAPQSLPAAHLSPRRGWTGAPWRLHGELDVESRVATVPACELATWRAGTAGFAAQQTANLLCEAEQAQHRAGRWSEFIVSGSIRPFQIRDADVRFMNQIWRRPMLNIDAAEISRKRRSLYQQPKIVVAGMSRRLTAAWDDRRRALGVQVYAATQLKADRRLLLALLNSSLLSCLFQLRYSGKRLAGGYFSVNKSQLEQLPIPRPDSQCPLQREIVELAADREACEDADKQRALNQQIDLLVLQLYQVDEQELGEQDQ